MVVAAVAVVLLFVNIFLVARIKTGTGHQALVPDAVLATELTRIYTERGTKATVVLPDSSKVWLNSDTEIEYVADFKGNTRDVSLKGEAYFEDKKDSLKPMMIRIADGYAIKVLGTKLHVKSYPNDNVSKTTLISGNIKVVFPADAQGKVNEISLKPSQTLLLGDVSKPQTVASPQRQISKDVAWKEGELVFDKTPMAEVVKMLERWHGTRILVENSQFYNHKLTATFKTESIIQILEVINMLTGIKYQIDFFIFKNRATLMIDTSGVPLHKRGYRPETVDAPIRETLAAAMVKIARPRENVLLWDPFCGSGTIAIEAAISYQATVLRQILVNIAIGDVNGM